MNIKFFSLKHLVYLRTIIWQFYKDKLYYVIAASFIFATAIYILNHFFYPSDFWNQFATEKHIEIWFCEFTDMKKLVRQPINTFTNLWYIVNAIFFFSKGISDSRKPYAFNLITANPFYSYVAGFAALYTFIGSTFFHSSLIEVASDIDFSAVYSVSLFPLMYYTHRFILLKLKKPTNVKHPVETTILVAIFTTIYLLLTFVIPMTYTHEIVLTFIALTVILGFILEKAEPRKTNKAYLLAVSIFITAAIIFFKMDIEKIGCVPESIIQPHSLWHICNAMAIFYFYLYIRSENYIPEKDEKLLPFREQFLD
ncbi:MAG: hypothetical protein R2777_08995 [Chitinophagales bacterium]|nr:ceramidase domain-containing protein [Chitinophagales bacterium]